MRAPSPPTTDLRDEMSALVKSLMIPVQLERHDDRDRNQQAGKHGERAEDLPARAVERAAKRARIKAAVGGSEGCTLRVALAFRHEGGARDAESCEGERAAQKRG